VNTPDELTIFRAEARRQVAAEDGQVGRFTRKYLLGFG
jgi:sRNA-binding carbon storage regulator CsrA